MLQTKELVMSFGDVYCEDGKLMLSSDCFNGLVTCDTDGKDFEVKRFPGITANAMFSHRNIHRVGDKLFFAPNKLKGIHMLDMKAGELSFFSIEEHIPNYRMCVDSYLWNGKIWMFFPYKRNGVISFDVETHKYERYTELTENIPTATDRTVIFNAKLTHDNEHVYGVRNKSNRIIRFNLKKKTTEVIEIIGYDDFFGITYLDNRLYISMVKSKKILEYTLSTKKYRVIEPDKEVPESNSSYCCICAYKGKVYLIDWYMKSIQVIENDKITGFCNLPEEFALLNDVHRKKLRPFYNIRKWEKGILLFPERANMMVAVDMEAKKAHGLKLVADKQWIEKEYMQSYFDDYVKESVECGTYMTENEWFDFNALLKYLNRGK